MPDKTPQKTTSRTPERRDEANRRDAAERREKHEEIANNKREQARRTGMRRSTQDRRDEL
ncbi:MAG: hypothetical protein JKY17_09410 [Magnetovibrio sp.]|nr:hypothetical protein [Magnetovibrio sp.]